MNENGSSEMRNNPRRGACTKNTEVNHIQRLADSQREWLTNARCSSSDSEDNNVKDCSTRRINLSGSPKSHFHKLGAALKRFPKETPGCSSSSCGDDDEGIVVIDRNHMYGRLDDQNNATFNKIKNHSSSSTRVKENQFVDLMDEKSKKSQKYQISIGDFSFDKSEVCILLGDSVHFLLVESEDSPVCGQHVLTGKIGI